jgi:NAD(P)-dependent dehydrogenase (short-subunit alcohol dehydrogenase family)
MGSKNQQRVLVFGATGAIGESLIKSFAKRGKEVTAVTRSPTSPNASSSINWVSWDPFSEESDKVPTEITLPFDAVVWAQGLNFNDNIQNFDAIAHNDMYRANVVYIMKTLHALLSLDLLSKPARLCIISSIWQNIARQNKLSYTVSKSALQGLIQSLAIDLGTEGHLVNAVLPGALDTPMTRSNLNAEQIIRLESLTPIGKLPSLDDVTNMVGFLCSPDNTGITGQFIAADRGFSYARIL